jgi:hypothetical protein
MVHWLAPLLAVTAVAVAIVVAYALYHERRRHRTRLRLLTGQQRVLSEEIGRHQEYLGGLDCGRLASARETTALDHLQVAVVERQAHLMDCEDLAHLLDCKIEALTQQLVHAPVEMDRPVTRGSRPAPGPAPSAPTANRQGQVDRSQLEDELRARINQLRNPPRS